MPWQMGFSAEWYFISKLNGKNTLSIMFSGNGKVEPIHSVTSPNFPTCKGYRVQITGVKSTISQAHQQISTIDGANVSPCSQWVPPDFKTLCLEVFFFNNQKLFCFKMSFHSMVKSILSFIKNIPHLVDSMFCFSNDAELMYNVLPQQLQIIYRTINKLFWIRLFIVIE